MDQNRPLEIVVLTASIGLDAALITIHNHYLVKNLETLMIFSGLVQTVKRLH